MKLWEILPNLKKGQKLKVTFPDKSQATYEYDGTYLQYTDISSSVSIRKELIEADYEILPQFIPFEQAFKALRSGHTIRCEYTDSGNNMIPQRKEQLEITPARASQMALSMRIMMYGTWWVVE